MTTDMREEHVILLGPSRDPAWDSRPLELTLQLRRTPLE